MKEYIERATAITRFTFEQGDYIPEKLIDGYDNVIAVRTIKKVLRDIPAADVAPVRHGRWFGEPVDIGGNTAMECSECHKVRVVDDYCSACGAKMDGKEDEHEVSES